MDNKSLKRILNDERVTYVVYAVLAIFAVFVIPSLSLSKCFR